MIEQLATPCLHKGGWPGASIKECRKTDETKAKRFVGRHKIYFEKRTQDAGVTSRRRCKVCQTQTTSGCKTCDVSLCLISNRLDSDPNDDCCFDKYHDPETSDLYD